MAGAIFHLAMGLGDLDLAHGKPAEEVPIANRKLSASEILRAMEHRGTTLAPAQSAWIPGGYLGMSQSWG